MEKEKISKIDVIAQRGVSSLEKIQESLKYKIGPNVLNWLEETDDRVAIPWDEIDPDTYNPVRHTTEPWLYFQHTDRFSPAANFFRKYGVYTFAMDGTQDYKNFWDEEERRCKYGYTVGDITIPGEYYGYLNYCRIEKRVLTKDNKFVKMLDFPDFLSMDYYWYKELEKAEKDGVGMICVKARRKGWSYKNAWGMVWNYNFFPKSKCVLGAFDSKWVNNTLDMAKIMIHFINEHTDWGKGFLIYKTDHIKSGYRAKNDKGVEIEKGFLSEILGLSFKDSPQKGIGITAKRFLFEEAGDWPGLLQALQRSSSVFRDGEISVGIPIIYGTGGNAKHNEDFQEIFYHPSFYRLKKYENIYDAGVQGEAGWFVSDMWYRPTAKEYELNGYAPRNGVDKWGNPHFDIAEYSLDEELSKEKQASPSSYATKVTQHPKNSKQAFLRAGESLFPSIELSEVLFRLKADSKLRNLGTVGELAYTDDPKQPVRFIADIAKKLQPIIEYPTPNNLPTLEGAVVIYEPPIYDPPYGLYKIGYDPVYHDDVDRKLVRSLGSIIVYKTSNKISAGFDEIVAEYTGRPDNTDVINDICLKLSLYYGKAGVMVESDKGKDAVAYFKRKGYFHLLEDQPDSVIAKVTKNPTVSRVKGAPMTGPMKATAEKFTLKWLLTERGVNGEGKIVRNMDLLPSIPLVQELIMYNRDGNFDRVSALFQIMLSIEEDIEKSIDTMRRESNPARYFNDNLKNFFKK